MSVVWHSASFIMDECHTTLIQCWVSYNTHTVYECCMTLIQSYVDECCMTLSHFAVIWLRVIRYETASDRSGKMNCGMLFPFHTKSGPLPGPPAGGLAGVPRWTQSGETICKMSISGREGIPFWPQRRLGRSPRRGPEWLISAPRGPGPCLFFWPSISSYRSENISFWENYIPWYHKSRNRTHKTQYPSVSLSLLRHLQDYKSMGTIGFPVYFTCDTANPQNLMIPEGNTEPRGSLLPRKDPESMRNSIRAREFDWEFPVRERTDSGRAWKQRFVFPCAEGYPFWR